MFAGYIGSFPPYIRTDAATVLPTDEGDRPAVGLPSVAHNIHREYPGRNDKYMTYDNIEKITNEYGREIKYYDSGSGKLWVLQDSTGIVGIVRADTWEEAYECAEDELFPEADEPTWDAIAKECGCDDPESLMDDAIFQESYGFRPNGANMTDKHGHGIYQKDLNGEQLNGLGKVGIADLKLTIHQTADV